MGEEGKVEGEGPILDLDALVESEGQVANIDVSTEDGLRSYEGEILNVDYPRTITLSNGGEHVYDFLTFDSGIRSIAVGENDEGDKNHLYFQPTVPVPYKPFTHDEEGIAELNGFKRELFDEDFEPEVTGLPNEGMVRIPNKTSNYR